MNQWPAVSDESEPPAEKTYKIGEKASDDDCQFTVTRTKCGVSRVGDSYSNEKAQGQFCLVSMRVKNVGNDAIHFADDNQALIDTKRKNCYPTMTRGFISTPTRTLNQAWQHAKDRRSV